MSAALLAAPAPALGQDGQVDADEAEETSDATRGFRITQIVGASLFGMSWLASVVVGAAFHDDNQDTTETRHVGYLAYPLAGPFIGMSALPNTGALFIPIGVTQIVSLVTMAVGTAGVELTDDDSGTEESRPALEIAPAVSTQGGGLRLGWSF